MIHVAVAVIENDKGEVLISKRHDHLHQGGLWEYPGGKVEEGEDVQSALVREIDEELGLHIQEVRPLIQIPHDYGDKHVLLDVFVVTQWSGEAQGREGQPLRWVAKSALHQFDFPAANKPITRAIQLPSVYVISPEPEIEADFLLAVERLAEQGFSLLQLRVKSLASENLRSLAFKVKSACVNANITLLINNDIGLARELGVGVHLTSRQLHELTARPLPDTQWVAASCHALDDLNRSRELGVDFVVLSPVNSTASHSDIQPLGWSRFAAMCERTVMPVYALGGMRSGDVDTAYVNGAQGVAGIRGFWPGI